MDESSIKEEGDVEAEEEEEGGEGVDETNKDLE